MIQCVGIVVKRDDARALTLASEVAHWINECGYQVYVEADAVAVQHAEHLPLDQMIHCVDIMLVLGGDGTLLSVGRLFIGTGIPILGINLGRLGFLTDTPVGSVYDTLKKILSGHYKTIEHFSLKAEVFRSGQSLVHGVAMNDVVMQRNNYPRPIEFDVTIRHQFAFRLHADGLILATPAGSTAYALSSGGPIIHPSVEAISVVPICPHTLSNRPIVVPADDIIELRLLADSQPASLNLDGCKLLQLEVEDVVRVHRGGKITLVYPPEHHYFSTLRNKLHWANDTAITEDPC